MLSFNKYTFPFLGCLLLFEIRTLVEEEGGQNPKVGKYSSKSSSTRVISFKNQNTAVNFFLKILIKELNDDRQYQG